MGAPGRGVPPGACHRPVGEGGTVATIHIVLIDLVTTHAKSRLRQPRSALSKKTGNKRNGHPARGDRI